jgi:hypothetical protein
LAEFDLDQLVRLERGADLRRDSLREPGAADLDHGFQRMAERPEAVAVFSGKRRGGTVRALVRRGGLLDERGF